MADPVDPEQTQPDLQAILRQALDETREQPGDPAREHDPPPLEKGQINIHCQVTRRDVRQANSPLDGGALSAGVAEIDAPAGMETVLFLACQRPGESEWEPAQMQGLAREGGIPPRSGGLVNRWGWFCVGGLEVVPDGGAIRIDLPDGQQFTGRASGGCCIALAPIAEKFGPDEQVQVRYFDAGGQEFYLRTF